MARTGARNKRTLYARQTNGAQTERAGTFPLHLVKPHVPVASGHGRVRASRSLRNLLFPLKHHPWNQLTSAHRQQALNRPNVPTKNLVAAAKCCIEIIHVFYRERKNTRQMFSIDTLSLLRITAYHPPQLLVHYSISYSILLSRNPPHQPPADDP